MFNGMNLSFFAKFQCRPTENVFGGFKVSTNFRLAIQVDTPKYYTGIRRCRFENQSCRIARMQTNPAKA